MESFCYFKKRISEFENEDFRFDSHEISRNQSLKNKVAEDGSFKAFYGDTVVFGLQDYTKMQIKKIVDDLYSNCPSLFAERLTANTFHMTLHDLNSGIELSDISSDCFRSELACLEIAQSKAVSPDTINLKSNFVFNMVNTSLVMGLIPETEEDFEKLTSLYQKFDKVKMLPYPFTPHITLGYFSPSGHKKEEVNVLRKLVSGFNKTTIHFSIDTRDLWYQKFTGMNDYHNLFYFVQKD